MRRDKEACVLMPGQRFSYYWEMRESVLLTIGESVTVNLDYVCLDNQSHYSLDVIEFQSESSESIVYRE